MQAQFMLPESNARVTKAFALALAIILAPPSVVLPVKVIARCRTSFARVADTVST